MKPVRVVLAEDHAVVRQGLRALLEREPGFSVVGETGDGLAVEALVARTHPDVLVLDLILPGLGGLDVVRQVSRRYRKTAIVVLSMHATDAFVIQALRNGAAGYVVKDSSAAELVGAIHDVIAGRRSLRPPLSERLLVHGSTGPAHQIGAYERLTTRERQVFQLAAEGLNNPEIGRRLGISPRTAETHRAHVMEKLGLSNRRDLILYALNRQSPPP